MIKEKRRFKIKQPDGTFAECEFRNLKKGDSFVSFEADGEPVDGGKEYVALSDAYPPYPLSLDSPQPEDGFERPWGIQIDDVRDGTVV